MTQAKRTCERCSYYEPLNPGTGRCHRWPPPRDAGPGGEASFPTVTPSTWCGEFLAVGTEDDPEVAAALEIIRRRARRGATP